MSQKLFELHRQKMSNKPLCSAERGADRALESVATVVWGVINLFLASMVLHWNIKRLPIIDKFEYTMTPHDADKCLARQSQTTQYLDVIPLLGYSRKTGNSKFSPQLALVFSYFILLKRYFLSSWDELLHQSIFVYQSHWINAKEIPLTSR